MFASWSALPASTHLQIALDRSVLLYHVTGSVFHVTPLSEHMALTLNLLNWRCCAESTVFKVGIRLTKISSSVVYIWDDILFFLISLSWMLIVLWLVVDTLLVAGTSHFFLKLSVIISLFLWLLKSRAFTSYVEVTWPFIAPACWINEKFSKYGCVTGKTAYETPLWNEVTPMMRLDRVQKLVLDH